MDEWFHAHYEVREVRVRCPQWGYDPHIEEGRGGGGMTI